MDIKIYGSRGTIPLSCAENAHYGGNTACVKVETLGRTIILDCGSGLVGFHKDIAPLLACGQSLQLDLLISHLHLDHIIGLPAFSPLYSSGHDISIYTKSRDSRPLAEQVFGAFKPPYWPVSLERQSQARCIAVQEQLPFMLGKEVKVTALPACHQDGTTAFRIDGDKSLVYMLDWELDPTAASLIGPAAFCKAADLVIFDSTYLPEDYPDKRGWGHSSYEAGLTLARESGCRQMIHCHLSHDYPDETLDVIAEKLGDGKHRLAYDGMELRI